MQFSRTQIRKRLENRNPFASTSRTLLGANPHGDLGETIATRPRNH